MKPLTFTDTCLYTEFAWRAAAIINFVFVMSFLLEYFDGDRDAEVEA